MKVVICCLVLVCLFLFGCKTLGDVITDYGYGLLQTPMNLTPPGTIVEKQSDNPVILEIVCSQAGALGDQFAVLWSPTYNREFIKKVSTTFDLNPLELDEIKSDATYKSIKNIKITLSNAKIGQLSADAVYASVPNRTPACQAAIDAYIKDGRKITMVSSVLQADVVYDVQFDKSANLSASAKEELLKGLASKLGIGHSNVREDKVSGQSLYWGIKDNVFLLSLRNDRKIVTENLQLGVKAVMSMEAFVTRAEPLIEPTPTSKIIVIKKDLSDQINLTDEVEVIKNPSNKNSEHKQGENPNP
jgi:hypothetical protein